MPGEETRERIVTAAERLFAVHGYAGTSMRQITRAAGVNLAAVNYHFGSKENLLVEVLDRIVGPLNAERLDLLDAAERRAAPDPPLVGEVLTAFLLPDLWMLDRLRRRDPALPRFVARMYTDASEQMVHLISRQFAVIRERFYPALATALPDLDLTEIAWRLQCVVGIVLYLFADVDVPGVPATTPRDTEELLDRLLAVVVPLMTAPPPDREEAPHATRQL